MYQITYYSLTEANLQVVLSTEFIGKHSFSVAEGWSLAEERQNQLDFDVTTAFALESIRCFQTDVEFNMDLSKFVYEPVRIVEHKGAFTRFYPSKDNNNCIMCYLCEKNVQ